MVEHKEKIEKVTLEVFDMDVSQVLAVGPLVIDAMTAFVEKAPLLDDFASNEIRIDLTKAVSFVQTNYDLFIYHFKYDVMNPLRAPLRNYFREPLLKYNRRKDVEGIN